MPNLDLRHPLSSISIPHVVVPAEERAVQQPSEQTPCPFASAEHREKRVTKGMAVVARGHVEPCCLPDNERHFLILLKRAKCLPKCFGVGVEPRLPEFELTHILT